HELEPAITPRASGAWLINGRDTSFVQRDRHVFGRMAIGKQPMMLEGGAGSSDRMLRLCWIRGNDYGVAAMTIARDGTHLCGIDWHEEAIPLFYGEQWFGEKTASSAQASIDPEAFAIAYL